MSNFDLIPLIGIPFKLNRRDFKGCDCRGIVWLYFKLKKNKEYPFTDGRRIFFRNKKQDKQRMVEVLKTFATPVGVSDLREDDIILLKNSDNVSALGVCINNKQVLHMDLVVGSCLTKLRYLRENILIGYRPND